jgi:hypothetical protein
VTLLCITFHDVVSMFQLRAAGIVRQTLHLVFRC